jgi:hypothetical protein
VITRKLKVVGRALDSITTQNNLAQFLNDTENAQKLNSLVGDIRSAMVGYQVCIHEPLALSLHLTISQTSLQQEICDKSCQMIVSPAPILFNNI